MKRNRLISLFVISLLLVGQTVFAGARDWQLDKAHSGFYFRIDHVFSKVSGHFDDFSAEIAFDPDNLAESSLVFKIKTKSVNTNIAKRDKHLQSADFFSADKFPIMSFESTKITNAGNQVYQVLGKFTVKGEVYDLTLPLTLGGIKDHPTAKNKLVLGFNSDITIDRLAYKVGSGKFVDLGVVGKDVDVFISLEALSDS